MALTAEILKSDATLASLSNEQISAIATLSANDEAVVIGAKIGEHHGLIEKDVHEVSGVAKNEGEKSYDYLKRVLSSYKQETSASKELQSKITTQQAKIQELENLISSGKGSEAIVKKLQDAESQLTALKTQYETDKNQWATKETEYSSKITKIKADTEFERALAGIKVKAGIPDSVVSTMKNVAKNNIMSQYKLDWVEAGGVKTMVFRDEKGEIVRNKANGLNPFTASELLAEQMKDIIDVSAPKKGAGTEEPGNPGVEVVSIAEVSSAKTQVEADALITKHLMQEGFVRGSAEFAERQKKIREDNKVDKLPIR